MKKVLLGMAAMLAVAVALVITIGNQDAPKATALTFAEVSAGDSTSCALVSSGGAVKCWGRNVDGELGIGTVAAPYQQSSVPLPVCASGVWNGTTCGGGASLNAYGISIGTAAGHNCALIGYLIVDCWGYNRHGQVGNGTFTTRIVNPAHVQCQGTSTYCSGGILAGIVRVRSGVQHTCGLAWDGNVWCWGNNGYGQLGDGSGTSRSHAQRVCDSGTGADCTGGSPLSGVIDIAVGADASCALTSGGAVKCWGRNNMGQVGDGTTTNRFYPVSVSGLSSGVDSIAAGYQSICAHIASDGSAKCWGYNRYGQLGDGTTTDRTAPVSVCASGSWNGSACSGSALSGTASLTGGGGHTCALMASSPYVKCWGAQGFGQLGNSVQNYNTPMKTPVAWTLPAWGSPQPTALAAGGAHTCAIIASYVQCWGWNYFGQLGNGTTSDTSSWIGPDTDKDGCIDAYELGPDHTVGGQRDPTNFYDFFDTPNDSGVRDKKVDSADATRVAARNGASGTPSNNPLSTPVPTAPGYHPAFDRLDDPNSAEAWDLIVGNGTINGTDATAIANQLNDTCATPTPTITPTP